jgi:hypothetical protein
MTGAVAALSADYSQDELDAIADAFGVPSAGSVRLSAGGHDAVLRAVLASALRGLVARRAIMLSGTAASPRIELLEPHGTLLGTFVGATRIVAIEERDAHGGVKRRVVFVRGDVAVEQRALGGQAIVRMTARPATSLTDLVPAPPRDDAAADDGRRPLEIAAITLTRTADELRATGADVALVDLVHARRRTLTISDTRVAGHRFERETTAWLDAGALGWWRLEPDDHEPPVTLRLVPQGAAPAL